MTKYKLKQNVLWYKKGTTFWFTDNWLFIEEPGEKPIKTMDSLFNQIANYATDDENGEYYEKIEESSL